MSDTLFRVTVQAAGPHGWSGADLVLPAECPLGTLLPAIVEAVVGTDPPQPLGWYASRVAGDRLDCSMTLRDSGVTDGEVIVLSATEIPAPQRVHGGPGAAVAAAARHHTMQSAQVAAWIGLAACLAGAAALAWSATSTPAVAHPVVAAACSAASAAAAWAMRRDGSAAAEVSGLAAVAFAAAAGLLAVPRAPWPATVLLTASAALAMATSLLRAGCRGSIGLGSVATATAGIAVAAAVCAVTSPSVAVFGSAATVVALVGLSLAAKLTVTLAGVGPAQPDHDELRATAAHQVLTGLVTGFAGLAAIGSATVALGAALTPETSAPSYAAAVLFTADIGLLLSLRRRVHADLRRRVALSLAGITALAAAGAAVVAVAPAQTYWIAGAAAAAGLLAMGAPRFGSVSNPLVHQAFQMLEYLSLAAVVPLAAWVSGVYTLVRELSLP